MGSAGHAIHHDVLDHGYARRPIAGEADQVSHHGHAARIPWIERQDTIGRRTERAQLAPVVVSFCNGPVSELARRIYLDRVLRRAQCSV